MNASEATTGVEAEQEFVHPGLNLSQLLVDLIQRALCYKIAVLKHRLLKLVHEIAQMDVLAIEDVRRCCAIKVDLAIIKEVFWDTLATPIAIPLDCRPCLMQITIFDQILLHLLD